MKNLIAQVYFDPKLITTQIDLGERAHGRGELSSNDPSVYEYSIALAKEYAKRVGADYVLFDKPHINFYNPTMERLRLIEEEKWANEYDNVLYVDADAFIFPECPDLFQMYPQNTLRVVIDYWNQIPIRETRIIKEFGTTKNYFNAGVMLFSKDILNLLRPTLDYRERFNTFPQSDQSELNYCVFKNKIPTTFMDLCYNTSGYKAKIAHLTGGDKKNVHKRHYKKAEQIIKSRGLL